MKLIIKQVLKVEKGKQSGALQYLLVNELSKDEVQAVNSDHILKVLKTRASHNLYICKLCKIHASLRNVQTFLVTLFHPRYNHKTHYSLSRDHIASDRVIILFSDNTTTINVK